MKKLDRTKYFEQVTKIRKTLFGNATNDGLLFKLMIYILLIGISYVFVYPLIQMLSMSFMSTSDLLDPEVEWIPRKFNLNTIRVAIRGLNMPSSLINSIWYSGLLGSIQTVIAALTGFAFARFDFKGKRFWFVILLASFIVPLPLVMIPRTMMFLSFSERIGVKLVGTITPMIVLTLLGQGVNNAILVLIFHNFFRMIPISLDEAARIDGATPLQVFWHIFIKMSLPVIVVVFLFSFVWNWNESYMSNMLMGRTVDLLPKRLGVFESAYQDIIAGNPNQVRLNESFRMAATLMSIIPLFLIYIFAQRQFIEGIERTGITGE
ncbi:MAG TPA: carbohydrate ABC transporter permease [Haloplasmataceae bacterium]